MKDSKKYYAEKLSSERLQMCYEIAPPRVKQYLDAEVEFVLSKIHPGNSVLDLGCGYGRVIPKIKSKAGKVIGIDNSLTNLIMGKGFLRNYSRSYFCLMDAAELGFKDNSFDVVIAIQNGLSAFKVNQVKLINEAIRVTRYGGIVLFSSYSQKFWRDRLKWFQLQASHELLGEIDYDKTKDGTIICKDGFKATTISEEYFINLVNHMNVKPIITEVDNSSIFFEINKKY
ncbi:MAG: hypothetical protein A2V66_05745 [Ignavibacteria bacterium RBG_13_36_8]|nr:MAG: hypothetical protein A2V66_05745 [Ignavibacteria bacterium RBG_13_36_8]